MYAKLIPYVLAAALASGATVGITRLVQPAITVETKTCPQPEKCPPCQGIDFDKIKNVKGLTIQNSQYMLINHDTLSIPVLEEVVRKVINEQRLARCK